MPKVAYREQGGLLGVAIHPDFSTNSLVYLSYVEAAEQQLRGPIPAIRVLANIDISTT